MRLYLDDDCASHVLTRLLVQDGHDVQQPTDTGLSGSEDPVHLRYSIREDRVLLTRNYRDFELLHELVMQAGGRHPKILVVRQDNDLRRDLTYRGIVQALANLLRAGIPLDSQFTILNHWR